MDVDSNGCVLHVVCGRWRLGQEIGHGAYGVVHLATNSLGERAAVKLCVRDEMDRERYVRELRGAKLYQTIPEGEGLIKLLELGECDWGFYSVLELADDEFDAGCEAGGEYRPKTLSHIVAGEKALSLEEALRLGVALAKGLVALQRHHLLHRDVKPGNVVYVRGRPVLADLGLLVEESEAASLVGTPGYVPPENFTDGGGDVYSLGLTLKAASFGRPVEELERGPTLEADTGNPLFPAWWRILNKATHPNAACRYRSAKALLSDLQSLNRRRRLMPFSRRIPQMVLWFVFVVVVVSVVVAFRMKKNQDEYIIGEQRISREYIEKMVEETKRDIGEVLGGLKEVNKK